MRYFFLPKKHEIYCLGDKMPLCRICEKVILFVHISKCGGTSIETLLEKESGEKLFLREVGQTNPLNNVSFCSPQHYHASILSKLLCFEKIDFIFTIIRNPFARLLSEFSMRSSQIADSKGFNEWYLDSRKLRVNDPYLYDNHLRPMSEFVCEKSKVYALETGLESIWKDIALNIGFPYRYSDPGLKSNNQYGKWQKIKRKIGLQMKDDLLPASAFPRISPGGHRKAWLSDISQEVIELIREDYKEDFRLYRSVRLLDEHDNCLDCQ
jgi:hypothetical protein